MEQMATCDGSLCDRLTVLEKLIKYVEEHVSKIDSRKRPVAEVDCPRNPLERDEEGYARKTRKVASEAEVASLEGRNSLNGGETEHVELSGVGRAGAQSIHPRPCTTLSEIEARERAVRRAEEKVAERERKVDESIGALIARIKVVECREKEYNCYVEEKTREIVLKEEELRLKLENEKHRNQHQLKDIVEIVERVKSAENKVEGVRENLNKRLEEIECRENVAWESVALSVKQGELILEDLEKNRSESDSSIEEITKELEFKGKQQNEIREKDVNDAKLREEILITRERSIYQQLEEFNSLREEKMRELDSKEQLLNESSGNLITQFEEFEKMKSEFNLLQEKKMGELDSKEQLLNESSGNLITQFEEFEKMKSEFNSLLEKKMGELDSKEQLLNSMSEKVANNAKLSIEKMIMQERSINKLIRKLNLAKDDVVGLKDVVDKRFKILVSKETVINSTSDWVERRMDEADSKEKMLVLQKKRLEDKLLVENELREKEKELDLREEALQAWKTKLENKQKEVEGLQKDVEVRKISLRGFTDNCFKDYRAKKKELLLFKDLVEKVARFLGLEDENLKNAIRELDFMEKQILGLVVERELIHQPGASSSNGHVRKELDESADLKFTMRMDGKNLQMFLNDPGKDLVSMGDEIFTVLQLSLDPAKLVLDAMVGFYPPHLREGDTELDVRRTCIILLQQLRRMARIIKPCVREEAVQVALAWKSKMAESPSSLEALGFLLLLKVYDIASSFDKYEISSLLTIVSQHTEERPDLDHLPVLINTRTEKNFNPLKNAKRGGDLDIAASVEPASLH